MEKRWLCRDTVQQPYRTLFSLPLSPADRSSSPGHEFAGSSSPKPPSGSSGLPQYADMEPGHPVNMYMYFSVSLWVHMWCVCSRETYHNLFICALPQGFFETLGFVLQGAVLERQSVHLVLKRASTVINKATWMRRKHLVICFGRVGTFCCLTIIDKQNPKSPEGRGAVSQNLLLDLLSAARGLFLNL